MLCYKDMTFCTAACRNTGCNRLLTQQVQQAADRWWGGPDAPIAQADFSDTCSTYMPAQQPEPNDG